MARKRRDRHNCQVVNLGSDYTDEELAFMLAMDRYRRLRRRPWPEWLEALHVAHSLGYRKVAPPSPEVEAWRRQAGTS